VKGETLKTGKKGRGGRRGFAKKRGRTGQLEKVSHDICYCNGQGKELLE